MPLVSSRKEDTTSGGLACHHTLTRCRIAIERDATDGCLRLVLDLLLCLRRAIPMRHDEYSLLDLLLELLVGIHIDDIGLAMVVCLLEDVRLDLLQQVLYILLDARDRTGLLLQGITTHHLDRAVL